MLGTNIIIFLTGMATLDQTLIEAARVDGLSRWQIFSRVTVPLLKRFIQFSFVITVISAFSALFSLIFVMTNGGPGFAPPPWSSSSTSPPSRRASSGPARCTGSSCS
jgi:multiple sugar transport system permease protein